MGTMGFYTRIPLKGTIFIGPPYYKVPEQGPLQRELLGSGVPFKGIFDRIPFKGYYGVL